VQAVDVACPQPDAQPGQHLALPQIAVEVERAVVTEQVGEAPIHLELPRMGTRELPERLVLPPDVTGILNDEIVARPHRPVQVHEDCLHVHVRVLDYEPGVRRLREDFGVDCRRDHAVAAAERYARVVRHLHPVRIDVERMDVKRPDSHRVEQVGEPQGASALERADLDHGPRLELPEEQRVKREIEGVFDVGYPSPVHTAVVTVPLRFLYAHEELARERQVRRPTPAVQLHEAPAFLARPTARNCAQRGHTGIHGGEQLAPECLEVHA
jgi:hypothetical protein